MPPHHRTHRSRRSPTVLAIGMVLSAGIVWQASYAAFTGTTSNPNNTWATGTVTLTDDDGGSSPTTGTAMFTATGMRPGDPDLVHCVRVTYAGSLTAPVKLYATSVSGDLAPYLDLTVEEGTGGTFADCSGFATPTTIFNSTTPPGGGNDGTLNFFTTSATGYASGVGAWTPTGAGQTRTYRFTIHLHDDDDAQDKSAQLTFTWEARS